METPLHRYIGAITFRSRFNQKQLGKGTGTLISPNLVLTVAHNIYNRNTGEIYKDFKFYPQQFGKLDDPYEVEDFFLPGKFCLDPDVSSDYALLKLKKRK